MMSCSCVAPDKRHRCAMFKGSNPFQKMKQMLLINIFFCVSVSGQNATGAVRLVDGPGICAGRVEIFYNNSWGSVCHDFWDSPDAQVVCRQLNCGSSLRALGNAFYRMANVSIWMDDVHCMGTEAALSECQHNGWGHHNCLPHEAASVICSENLPKPKISAFQNSSHLKLECTVPRLYLNVMVYLIEMQANVTQATFTLIQSGYPSVRRVATFVVGKGNHRGAAKYTCRYQTLMERNATYASPLSDPVCIGYRENNGTKITEISDDPLLCSNVTVYSLPSPETTTSSGLATETTRKDSEMTKAAPNQPTITEPTRGDSEVTTDLSNQPILIDAVTSHLAEETSNLPNNTGLVTVISLAVVFTLLLLVFLVIFLCYRNKRSSLPERDIAQANEYIDKDLLSIQFQTNQEKDSKDKTKLEMKMPPKNEVVYEVISHPMASAYERTIFYIDTSSTYESLNDSTKNNDIYEVLK